LFDAFVEKQTILHLLERCSSADGVQIYLGEDSEFGPLEGCSMVSSTYKVGNRVVGALGVIGPTRMAYDRVIPLVDVTAKLIGKALKTLESSP
jgi:heat-inducible transcriptional repressor